MKIVESLQDLAPETGGLRRAVLLGPDTGSPRISAVLVRVPPQALEANTLLIGIRASAA